MQKKILFFLSILFLCSLSNPSRAVLQEENLDRTIVMLHKDLQGFYSNLHKTIDQYNVQRINFWEKLNAITEESQELSIVLYSQQEYFIFGMAQASQRVRNIYERFNENKYPFQQWKESMQTEAARYERLKQVLLNIDSAKLSPEGYRCKNECITICNSVENELSKYCQDLEKDDTRYATITKQMEDINQYNTSVFDQIRQRVFFNGTETYMTTLSNFKERWKSFSMYMYEAYCTGQSTSESWVNRKIQLWIGSISLLLISIGLSFLFIYKWLPKAWRKPEIISKKNYYVAILSCFLFAIFMSFGVAIWLTRYYFIVSSMLFIEFVLLIGIILLSLALRLNQKHIRQGLYIYLPILCTAAILMFYRITLASSVIVGFTIPLVLLISAIVQLIVLLRHSKGVPRTDAFYGWLTFIITIACMLVSWSGFRFLSLFLSMLWVIWLVGIQGIICLRHLLKFNILPPKDEKKNFKTIWFDSFINMLLIPLLCLFVLAGGAMWAAHIFNMSSWIIDQLQIHFIDIPDVGTISVGKIIYLIGLAVIFNYTIYIVKEILRSIYEERFDSGGIRVSIMIGTFLTWGVYAIVLIRTLNLNNSSLMAAVGGMGMGIGFALKDTLDNLFCGLSLMMGRVRIGDMIECDGVRGRIASIGTRSTMIETIDGSIIAFLNNQLFAKNFKNLTKNHEWEAAKIEIGIAYGENVEKARKVIEENIQHLPGLAPHKKPVVFLDKFGASSVDLTIIVWVPVNGKGGVLSSVREHVYEAFAKENITIPFPQQDVHIKES